MHDILTTLRRRFPAIPVILYPTAVQGETAAAEIVARIRQASRRADCDVLILARGGGSLEDLRAFNEESVARAIHECRIPLVSGVGHEIDFTIADFVADRRAATPTAAAELVSPDREDLLRQLRQLGARLERRMREGLQSRQQRLYNLQRRLRHPGRRLQDIAQRLDDLESRLQQGMKHRLRHEDHRLRLLSEKLHRHQPGQALARLRERNGEYRRRLRQAMQQRLTDRRRQLQHLLHQLDTVSPLATLSRGYSITTALNDQRILRSNRELKPGQQIRTRLAEGRIISTIEKLES